jgi:hypothetical protein
LVPANKYVIAALYKNLHLSITVVPPVKYYKWIIPELDSLIRHVVIFISDSYTFDISDTDINNKGLYFSNILSIDIDLIIKFPPLSIVNKSL